MFDNTPFDFEGTFPDLDPIPQDDGPCPLAQIVYMSGYADAMGYLRALMAIPEYSQRAVDLTAFLIAMNPAHYTCWGFRLKSVFKVADDAKLEEGEEAEKAVLLREMAYLNGVAVMHQKNYQIWHHRQLVMERLGDFSGETEFIGRMFELDSKNYHVWSYRQWLVRRFGLWEGGSGRAELEYVEGLIREDVRNNSAWNHRWFVVFGRFEGAEGPGKEVIEREMSFTQNAIYLAPQNLSPWNYLRGLLEHTKTPLSNLLTFCNDFAPLSPTDKRIPTKDEVSEQISSSHALEILAEIYAEQKDYARVNLALDLLVERFDRIRKNYWEWRRGELVSQGAGAGSEGSGSAAAGVSVGA